MNLNQTPNRRILIIDDNPVIHEDFRKILRPVIKSSAEADRLEEALFEEGPSAIETMSFELDSAFQGQDGFEMVKQALAANRPYAMAFVDVRMPPGWDGVETISRLWEVSPELQIVLCTAYSDYSWEELLAKLGRPDNWIILKKPFDNVEVQQLALALTGKWLLNLQAALKLSHLEAMVEQRTNELHQANKFMTVGRDSVEP